jgi:dipeptidyl aminopeptidase/acylaminoacyl peptidase
MFGKLRPGLFLGRFIMHAFRRAALRALLVLAALFAAPVIAADPLPLSAYGDLPALESGSLSPGGNLALLGQFKGKRMLVILDPSLKPLKAMEVPADLKVRDITWVGDESVLVERTETVKLDTERFTASKGEIPNVMIVPVDNSKPVQTVFADERKMVKAVFYGPYIRSVGGKWYGYFGGREMAEVGEGRYEYQGSPTSLYAVDVLTNQPKRVGHGTVGGIWRDWLLDSAGEIAATLDWRVGSHDWTLQNKSGDLIASGNQPKGEVSLVAFGKDGKTAIYSEVDASKTTVWYEVPLDGSAKATEFLPDETIDSWYVQPFTSRMIGYRPDDAQGAIVFFDPAMQAMSDGIMKAYAGINPRFQAWTPDFHKVLLTTNGNGDSGTWYLLDTVSKQAQLIGQERPQIGARVGPISTVDYKAADGTELRGILTLPLGRPAKNLPLVVFPHGGPHAEDFAQFDWWAQAFASRGYAVFQPNFRGSTDRDEAFMRAGYGQWGRKMQTDISDGLAELVKRGVADPKRACIMGASYGGYAALAGVTLQQGLYRCAVAVAGVSDLKMMYDSELYESGRNRFLKTNLKEDLGDPSTLAEVSPRRYAARADAPILLIHGQDDTVVPFQQTTVMADALKDAGKPYEMVVLNKEDHWLSRAETRKQMLEAAVAFVEKNNPAD